MWRLLSSRRGFLGVTSLFSRVSLLFLCLLALAAPAQASAATWTSTSVRGVAFYLLDGKWQELDRDQQFTEASLRTLRGGHVNLSTDTATLDVGPNSAIQLATRGSSNIVQQYEGVLGVAVISGQSPGLTVRAGAMTLTRITGELLISMADKATSVSIKSGTVSVASADGKREQLGPGVYQVDTGGAVVVASQTVDGAVVTDVPPAKVKANENANPNSTTNNAGGNGNGNGNAGGNGNGNSNAGGNGNGNGNAGGNGNGNGNAGGNGNGNGNK